MPSKSVRGFNANEKSVTILNELDIPKMGFSKFMNTVLEEWHSNKLNGEQEKPRSSGKIVGVALD